MRVVCEFCQTVYNIPDEKLVRDTSQATCKVCKNKILIRRTRAAIPESPSTDPTLPRVPSATPTRVSDAFPASPPSMATTEPSAPAMPVPVSSSAGAPPADEVIHETELSNSWREAIVDNRGTIDLLRKTGISVPALSSTAAGPAVSVPSPSTSQESEDDAEPTIAEPLPPPHGATRGAVPLTPRASSLDEVSFDGEGPSLEIAGAPKPLPVVRPAAKTAAGVSAAPRAAASAPFTGRVADARASSAAISAAGAMVSAAAGAALVHNGGWSLGLSGVAALGACAFTAAALALDAALRRRGPIAVGGISMFAALAAAAVAAAVLATGGARTRALAAEHAFLEPFARLTLPGGGAPETPPEATPETTPEATPAETPAEPPADPDETPAASPESADPGGAELP